MGVGVGVKVRVGGVCVCLRGWEVGKPKWRRPLRESNGEICMSSRSYLDMSGTLN